MTGPRAIGLGLLLGLAACSGDSITPPAGGAGSPARAVAARIVADDSNFDAAAAQTPRFVACRGLSGCARSAPGIGDRYPGAAIPASADDEVDHTVEFVLYLVGARFEQADLADDTLHVAVTERDGGLQMVKLDGRHVLASAGVSIRFVARGREICRMGPSWEGCSG